MKNFRLTFGVVFLVLLMVASCSKNDLVPKANSILVKSNLLDSVGYWHNFALTSLDDDEILNDTSVSYSELRDSIVSNLNSNSPKNFVQSKCDSICTEADSILIELELLQGGELSITESGLVDIFERLNDEKIISKALMDELIDLNEKV